MTTTPEYDAMLARKMAERHAELLKTDTHYQANVATQMHKVTTMTEAETQAEIERIQDGAKSSFGIADGWKGTFTVTVPSIGKKRRGRPPGSKNKSKEQK